MDDYCYDGQFDAVVRAIDNVDNTLNRILERLDAIHREQKKVNRRGQPRDEETNPESH